MQYEWQSPQSNYTKAKEATKQQQRPSVQDTKAGGKFYIRYDTIIVI